MAPNDTTKFSELTFEDIRPEVLEFALLMEYKLRENDFKGGWKNDSVEALLKRVDEELDELREELYVDDVLEGSGYEAPIERVHKIRTTYEAADVANMLMMIVDNILRPPIRNTNV